MVTFRTSTLGDYGKSSDLVLSYPLEGFGMITSF
jgi:hypothetical protein